MSTITRVKKFWKIHYNGRNYLIKIPSSQFCPLLWENPLLREPLLRESTVYYEQTKKIPVLCVMDCVDWEKFSAPAEMLISFQLAWGWQLEWRFFGAENMFYIGNFADTNKRVQFSQKSLISQFHYWDTLICS